MNQPLPTCKNCEYQDWLIEQSALRGLAIRKLAIMVHKHHIMHTTIPWNKCMNHECRLAQDALEGKLSHEHPV